MLLGPRPRGAGRRFFRHHGCFSMLKRRPSGFTWGKENDVLGLDDPPDPRPPRTPSFQADALAVAIGAQQPDGEVDQDVGSSPFAAVYAGDEADSRALFGP